MVAQAKLLVTYRMICRELRWPLQGPTTLFGDSKAAFDGAKAEKQPAKERFLSAQRGCLRLWFKERVLAFQRVSKDALRPDLFTKSELTSFRSDSLAYWVQVGKPQPDDAHLALLVQQSEGVGGARGAESPALG